MEITDSDRDPSQRASRKAHINAATVISLELRASVSASSVLLTYFWAQFPFHFVFVVLASLTPGATPATRHVSFSVAAQNFGVHFLFFKHLFRTFFLQSFRLLLQLHTHTHMCVCVCHDAAQKTSDNNSANASRKT